VSVRIRESYGTSWRDPRTPGTRRWRSTSVSYGFGTWFLGRGLWGLFVLPFALLWYLLLAELWLCAEAVLLTVSGVLTGVALARRQIRFADVRVTGLRYGLFVIDPEGARP
jgi:hypothetical protein